MNAALQLPLFPESYHCLALRNARQTIEGAGTRHDHFRKLTRALAVTLQGAPAGSTIVLACSSQRNVDEVLFGTNAELQMLRTKSGATPTGFRDSLIEVSLPASFTRQQLEKRLWDQYRHAIHDARIYHRFGPQFLDFGLGTFLPRTDIGAVAELLKTKQPELVVLREANHLDFPNASHAEQRAAWRRVIDIAVQSHVTHVICAPITTVHEIVFGDPCFQHNIYRSHVLMPYSLEYEDQKRFFLGVLNDYNSVLPWADDESLAKHPTEIDAAVAGDVSRLHNWILSAIDDALASDHPDYLSWDNFENTSPSHGQRLLAAKERQYATEMGHRVKILRKIEDNPQRRPRLPGRRKPHRDPYVGP